MRRLKKYSFLFLLLLLMIPVQSASAKKKVVMAPEKFRLNSDGDLTAFEVKSSSKSVFMINLKLKLKDDCESGGIRIRLFNDDDEVIQKDYWSLGDYASGTYEAWFYNDDLLVPKGRYYYEVKNTSDTVITATISVSAYTQVGTSITMNKSASVIGNDSWVKVGQFPSGQLPLVKKFSSSSSAVKNWSVDTNGNVYVCGNKSGKATVSFKLTNGKIYRCTVTVKPGEPDFFADVYGYYTRDNYFLVRFKNVGRENLVIHPSGAYSMEVDYKSYDRKLNVAGNRTIVIKPGESKKVKFMVKGYTTYPDYECHTVRYYFSYGGVRYLGSTWYNGSSYKKGTKWFTTYWNMHSDDYDDWV